MPSNSSSPPETTSFMPRREFRREDRQPNSFALLAIASANCIRLYSFPLHVIVHLRRFLDKNTLIAAYREDVTNNFCEFALQGKPWTSTKSVATERLLVELMAIIYYHGYIYLSTIDYGREHDDRLAMAFSKPPVRPDSPASPDHSKGSFADHSKGTRVPFALSFPSTTLLRVICPPLDLTPAILQAVRGSWPRGVVSEKKVGDNSFEFKLKGYKWFQQDTFATDSLRHILSLLSSLDAHSFSLLTSISLTNSRSRVKDLWLFTGPVPSSDDVAYPESPAASINASQTDFKRNVHSPELPPYQSSFSTRHPQHRRFATEPVSPAPSSPLHARVGTDDPPRAMAGSPTRQLEHTSPSPSPTPSHRRALRKPAPRAQLPVSVYDETVVEPFRAPMPSHVPSGIENMTGVGAATNIPVTTTCTPEVFYSTSPFQPRSQESAQLSQSNDSPEPSNLSASQHSTSRLHQSPQQVALPAPVPLKASIYDEPNIAPLLGSGVFRDTAFSSSTDMSTEIPIKWTGTGLVTESVAEELASPPDFPGGWQSTPVEEKQEINTSPINLTLDQDKEVAEPIQDVGDRVASPASPALSSGPDAFRKSEAGLVGMVACADKGKQKETSKDSNESKAGEGWVLVNVEAKSPVGMIASPDQPNLSSAQENFVDPTNMGPSSFQAEQEAFGKESNEVYKSPGASLSPAAKAVVILEPTDAKSKMKPGSDESSSRLRRLFSMTRKDSKVANDDGKPSTSKKKKTRSSVHEPSA